MWLIARPYLQGGFCSSHFYYWGGNGGNQVCLQISYSEKIFSQLWFVYVLLLWINSHTSIFSHAQWLTNYVLGKHQRSLLDDMAFLNKGSYSYPLEKVFCHGGLQLLQVLVFIFLFFVIYVLHACFICVLGTTAGGCNNNCIANVMHTQCCTSSNFTSVEISTGFVCEGFDYF